MKIAGIAALVVTLLLGGVLFAGSLLRRAVLLTTADPSALGLVASESRKPVTLTLRATLEQSARNEFNDVDHRLSFTLPAAYVTVVDLKDGPRGSQRLGFELWSVTLDPVTPDASEEHRQCKSPPCPDGPYSKRQAAGEYDLRIEVTSVIGTEAYRQSGLRYRSGLDLRDTHLAGRPCAVGYDAARDLVTVDAPPGKRHSESCNFIGNGSLYRGTVRAVPRGFAKRNPDDSLRYAVRCSGFSEDPRAESMCELQGYFGIWPLFLWVRPSRIDDWDDLFARVSGFLTSHVATRTDLAVKTGAVK